MEQPEQVRITTIVAISLVGAFGMLFAVLFTISHGREIVSIATGIVSIAAIVAVVYWTQKLGDRLQTRKGAQNNAG